MGTRDRRYRAPLLREFIDKRGLRYGYVAARVGIHASKLSRVMNGTETLSEPEARRLAALLSEPFDAVFELRVGSESLPALV